MSRKRWSAATPLARVAVLALTLLVPPAAVAPAGAEDAPVTLYQWTTISAPTLDPQFAADPLSRDIAKNLFLGLTDYHPETGEVRPELATAWTVSADGRAFTFTLRDDVYWVRHDPNSQVTARVRPVTAQDFVDGVGRACSSANPNAALLASVVQGCDAVYHTPIEDITAELLAQVDVSAPSPDTLIIRTYEATGWFLSITPTLRPIPPDAISRYGNAWTLPGNLVTNGPFVLGSYTPGHRLALLRANPHLPADLAGPGNVERVVYDIVRDVSAGFALYVEHKVDASPLPPAEEAALAGQRPAEVALIPDLRVAYVGFAHERAPFNDARVRRAFATSIDRHAFVDQALGGAGRPLAHLAPPEVFGAPPVDWTGVGYDPEYARQQFAEAGYPECRGFPTITILAYDSAASWIDFALAGWREVLGCDLSLFRVELVRFSELLERTAPEAGYRQRPHLFTLAWLGDYPDENNWVGDLLWCQADPRTRRPCTATDDLIQQAAVTMDSEQRRDLYTQIEEAFFGPGGEMPLIVLYQRAWRLAIKPWVSSPLQTDGVLDGAHWDWVTIDQPLQLRCRALPAGSADAAECAAPPAQPLPSTRPTKPDRPRKNSSAPSGLRPSN